VFCYFLRDGGGDPLGAVQPHAGRTRQDDVRGPALAGAGMTLATYFPFTTTALYQTRLAHLPWPLLLTLLMILLTILM